MLECYVHEIDAGIIASLAYSPLIIPLSYYSPLYHIYCAFQLAVLRISGFGEILITPQNDSW